MSDVYISLEFTPNPNTLKYSTNQVLLPKGGAYNFIEKAQAQLHSPLADKLFNIPGIAGVMIGKDFVTVTKSDAGDWDTVHQNASKSIQEHLEQKAPILAPELEVVSGHKGGDSAIENKIREILDAEIRPAVAQDGGDITFDRFEDGIVYLYLQGSCSGCPSSTATLKGGIETRLKQHIPEVIEVVAI